MIKYVFSDRPMTFKAADSANPQAIGEALEKIGKASGGRLTPKDVVEEAKAKNHPLHKHLEWDDGVCGEAYRLIQARSIIQIIRVEDEKTEEVSRAFVSIADKGGTSYRHSEEIKSSFDLQRAVMEAATRDLLAWERRYRDLLDICKLVRAAREKLEDKISKSETRVGA